MGLKLKTAPTERIATVDDARAQVEAYGNAHDAKLAALVLAAESNLDGPNGRLGRALVTQTWTLTLDEFPCGAIKVPLPPLQSVTSIQYVDTNGALQTLAPADYTVDVAREPAIIVPAWGKAWPAARSQPGAVSIEFVAGFGDASKVPASIKQAALIMVADMFENREAQITGTISTPNATVDVLLFPNRMIEP